MTKVNRINPWALSALLLLTSIRADAAKPAYDQTTRPNIILCLTDDQGWGDVSYNGLKKIQTPNLDSMAAAGLRFNRFYAQQSCSPARASVMTGRHPNRMGVFWPGMPLRRQEVTIAQAAKAAGYATAHFGKWHLNGSLAAVRDPQLPRPGLPGKKGDPARNTKERKTACGISNSGFPKHNESGPLNRKIQEPRQ